jgi:hypothetical protein
MVIIDAGQLGTVAAAQQLTSDPGHADVRSGQDGYG